MMPRHRLAPGPLALAAAAALGLAVTLAPAGAAAATPTAIRIPAGATSTTVHGAIARGETARYTFDARADQWVELGLSSLEGNGTALVYGPGWRIDDAGEVVRGETEMRLGADAGTEGWSDVLAATGSYLVVIGSTRGGSDFDLALTLRSPQDEDCQELSQGPMNVCFEAIARRQEGARARAYAQIESALDGEARALLAAAEKAWRGYRDATCRLEASPYEGGSLQPTIYSTCRARLTAARTAELERQREDLGEL